MRTDLLLVKDSKKLAKKKKQLGRRTIIYCILLIIAFISLGPFAFMFLISIQHTSFISGNPTRWLPHTPTLGTYIHVFKSSNFFRWLINSCLVGGGVTLLTLLIHSMSGYVFAKRQFPGRDIIFLIILSSIMVPRAVTILPQFLIVTRFHWLNTYLALIMPPLSLPIGVFMMKQFISTLPSELEEAARLDGCSDFGIFGRVILPLSKPGLVVLGIYTFMEQWRDFIWPLIVTTVDEMKTLPVGLSTFHTEFQTDYGVMMAGVMLSILPISVVFLFGQRYFVKGLTLGAVKG
ncbi:MAG: carbohydrate ABC transporter permease [Firmicutes bacterium]|nr:carbohydrate ABC transporter permease [Bacillota bacterium]